MTSVLCLCIRTLSLKVSEEQACAGEPRNKLFAVVEDLLWEATGAEKSVQAHVEGPMWLSACSFFRIS